MRRPIIIAVIILPVVLWTAAALARQQQPRRNPFAPLAKTAIRKLPKLLEPVNKDEASDAELKLNGIIWSKRSPIAIINDKVVEIGSQIAGRRVSAISITHVELQYYDKKETLKITPKFLFSISSKKKMLNNAQNSVTK